MEQLVCYWPDPTDPMCSAVRRAALPLKLRVKYISPEQTGQRLGFLLGRKNFTTQEGDAPAVADPILILDGFSSPRMDALLRVLARAKVPRSVFKAVATADNVNWTLAQFWMELRREREALERGEAPAHT